MTLFLRLLVGAVWCLSALPSQAAGFNTDTCTFEDGKSATQALCDRIRATNEKAAHDAANLDSCLDSQGQPLGPRCASVQAAMRMAKAQATEAAREHELERERQQKAAEAQAAVEAAKSEQAQANRQAAAKAEEAQRIWLSQPPTSQEIQDVINSMAGCIKRDDQMMADEREVGRESGFVDSQKLYMLAQNKIGCKRRLEAVQSCPASKTCRRPV